MDLSTFIVAVFCLIDDQLEGSGRLRRRGPAPRLADSEVLTIETVGEFLGLDNDEAIRYFREHYGEWFPALRKVHRHLRQQAANLWTVKESIRQGLLSRIPHDPAFALCDSMPLPACLCARLPLPALPRRGGLRQGHAPQADLLRFPGTPTSLLAGRHHPPVGGPANVHELSVLPELVESTSGLIIGDRNYHSPKAKEELWRMGIELLAPYSFKKRDPAPRKSAFLSRLRYRIDTVFSQPTGRYCVKRVWARDLWHLASRLLRKVLSHTVAFLLNCRLGTRPLCNWRSPFTKTCTSG
jgi:hypothetical protein